MDDEAVISAWKLNSTPWAQAISTQQIESRKLVTDKAIISAVLQRKPGTVLDIGCGEGWLARSLAVNNIQVLGVDAINDLIRTAEKLNRKSTQPRYRTLSYEEIGSGALQEKFDVVVANFSLLGKGSVELLLQKIGELLTPRGHLIIQTLHPVSVSKNANYRDGWREESWSAIGSDFKGNSPWYFRTLESWNDLFGKSNLKISQQEEPVHPQSGEPVSVIFTCEVL